MLFVFPIQTWEGLETVDHHGQDLNSLPFYDWKGCMAERKNTTTVWSEEISDWIRFRPRWSGQTSSPEFLAPKAKKMHFITTNSLKRPVLPQKVLTPPELHDSELNFPHIYNQYVIRAEQRDELREFLLESECARSIIGPISSSGMFFRLRLRGRQRNIPNMRQTMWWRPIFLTDPGNAGLSGRSDPSFLPKPMI